MRESGTHHTHLLLAEDFFRHILFVPLSCSAPERGHHFRSKAIFKIFLSPFLEIFQREREREILRERERDFPNFKFQISNFTNKSIHTHICYYTVVTLSNLLIPRESREKKRARRSSNVSISIGRTSLS